MTGQFEDFKSEIVARLAELLIAFVQQAAAAETLIQDFERELFDGLLPVGGKMMDIFLHAKRKGDQCDVIMHHDQRLDHSAPTVSRWLRALFGEHQIKATIDHSSPDLKSLMSFRPVNASLGLTADSY